MGPFGIGENGTLPDRDLSEYVKIAFRGRLKFAPKTLSDTIAESIMQYELTSKGIFRP